MARSWAKFGRRQEAAIAALLTQGSIEKAARVAEVSPRALFRWLQVPEFQAKYQKAQGDAFSQSIALLQKGSSAAVATLYKVMAEKATPASVRVRATDCFLNHAMKASEIEAREAPAPAAESDTDSNSRLRSELLGILRGRVESAVLCHRESLTDSPDVTVPEARREELDRLQEFFQDRCPVAAEGDVKSWKKEKCWVPVAELYPTYAAWAAATGDRHPFPKGPFEERLRQLGRGKERVPCDKSDPCDNVRVGFLSHAVTPSHRMEIEPGQAPRKEEVPNSHIGAPGRQPALGSICR